MAIAFCGKRIFLTRTSLLETTKRKCGYVILLPEIGEDLPEKDPLLKEDGLPEFNTFSIERAIAAVGKQAVLYEQEIKKIEDNIKTNEKIDIVNDILHRLEEITVPLETTWGIAKALYFGNQSLMPTKSYQSIHNRMVHARSTKYSSKPLYNALKEALENKNLQLNYEHRRLISMYVLEGKLNGLDLTGNKELRFSYAQNNIYKKANEMRQKIEIATKLFKTTIKNDRIVQDFPEEFLKEIAVDPNNPHRGPWKITLESHIVSQFLELCPDRELRWLVWEANVERGSLAGDSNLRTSSNLEDIRDHKIQQAKYLGYKSYSHMSMETKVAGNLQNVYRVMDSLLETARPVQEKEIADLTEFAVERGFQGQIRQWDIDYWMRKHLRSTLDYKEEFFKDYFPLPIVLNGLFQLIENLFNVRIVEGRKTDVWHRDVTFLDVIDLTQSDEPIGHLYLDPYTRGQNKVSSFKDASWIVNIQSRSKLLSKKPLSALIFNFRPPTADAPSLLTFKDVKNLFEKFGNALQHVLTRVDCSELAGTSNIEWDAVDVSGNFMANWLYEPSIIQSIANHYKTNEPLPDDKIASIKNARSHMAGYKLCKELYLGRLDLELHDSEDFWVQIMQRVWKRHFVIPRHRSDSHITSWLDIFSGNWGGSYYGHLWSEMIAADIYSAFEEIPVGDKEQEHEIAMRFRDTFLSLGGSVSAGEVFRRFRGRDPNSKALLKNLKLQTKSTEALE